MSTRDVLTLLALAVACYSPSVGIKLPSYLKICRRSDPELNKCALRNGREALPFVIKGDPKYHTPVLDPIEVSEIKVEHGAGKTGLSLIFKDLKLYGLKDTSLDDMRVDLKKRTFQSSYTVDRIEAISKYEIDGRILILPITGKGDCNVTLVGNTMNYSSSYSLYKKEDGLQYMNITDINLIFNMKKAYFHLTNLFNGDKFLGDSMNTFLNENWREVADEMSPSIIEVIKSLLINIGAGLADTVSYDDILPE